MVRVAECQKVTKRATAPCNQRRKSLHKEWGSKKVIKPYLNVEHTYPCFIRILYDKQKFQKGKNPLKRSQFKPPEAKFDQYFELNCTRTRSAEDSGACSLQRLFQPISGFSAVPPGLLSFAPTNCPWVSEDGLEEAACPTFRLILNSHYGTWTWYT